MTLDELVEELENLQAQGHGKETVICHDGLDPSDLCPVQFAFVTKEYFFDETGGSTKQCIKITT